jgi:hypothetical protein
VPASIGGDEFSILLKQGATVPLEIPAVNLRRLLSVPRVAGPVDFDELI